MQVNLDAYADFKYGSFFRSILFCVIASSSLISEVAFSQWVFFARHAVGRIEQMTQNQPSPGQPPTQVVTVILDAPVQRVFSVAINTIRQNRNVTIVNIDKQNLAVKISQDDQVATLSFKSLSEDATQLIVVGTAVPGQIPQTTRIVDGVMRLCGDLGKQCSLAS